MTYWTAPKSKFYTGSSIFMVESETDTLKYSTKIEDGDNDNSYSILKENRTHISIPKDGYIGANNSNFGVKINAHVFKHGELKKGFIASVETMRDIEDVVLASEDGKYRLYLNKQLVGTVTERMFEYKLSYNVKTKEFLSYRGRWDTLPKENIIYMGVS